MGSGEVHAGWIEFPFEFLGQSKAQLTIRKETGNKRWKTKILLAVVGYEQGFECDISPEKVIENDWAVRGSSQFGDLPSWCGFAS
jgi:hypothetical protein